MKELSLADLFALLNYIRSNPVSEFKRIPILQDLQFKVMEEIGDRLRELCITLQIKTE